MEQKEIRYLRLIGRLYPDNQIVLDRNPLDDIKNTRTINAVYIAGNRLK